MKPQDQLTHSLLLPELKLTRITKISESTYVWHVNKTRSGAVCTRCAGFSCVIHDSRMVRIRDRPFREKNIILEIKKHRYLCKTCKRPFTEPIPGIMPGRKTTQRLRKQIQWACTTFSDLKKVEKTYSISPGFIYQVFYEQLELKLRESQDNSFGEVIGIDEHCFGRKNGLRKREFVTMIVNHQKKNLREVVQGKTHESLYKELENVPGREKVKVDNVKKQHPLTATVTWASLVPSSGNV